MIRYLSILLIATSAHAVTNYVNGSSATTINTALSAASSGDWVVITNSGWATGTVTIPGGKNITLDGNNLTNTGDLYIPSSASYSARVTRLVVNNTDRYQITTGTGNSNLPWRFDHCKFLGSTLAIMSVSSGPGLIDHLSATNMGNSEQMIEPGYNGDAVSVSDGWHEVVTPGGSNTLYIEDSVFTHNGSIWDGTCVFEMEYGARVVCRSNILNNVMYEVHGSPGTPIEDPGGYSIGARWWEFYNTVFNTGAICIRAGSGLIFNNTGTLQFFTMLEEDSGYPSVWQVGRGEFLNLTDVDLTHNSSGANQTSRPAYVWGNSMAPNLNETGDCAAATAGMVQLNRDVFEPTSGTSFPGSPIAGQGFWRTDLGGQWNKSLTNANDGALYVYDGTSWNLYYTPYTYPHPLQNASGGGGGGGAALSPPSNLRKESP